MTPEQELFDLYPKVFDKICSYISRRFPGLASEAEDVAQDTVVNALEFLRKKKVFKPDDWNAWLRKVAGNRALDRLRRTELLLFEGLSRDDQKSPDPTDSSPSPGTAAEERERRGRQGKMLSDVLQEWCRNCEKSVTGLKHKECYERLLRGQKFEEIEKGMKDQRGMPVSRNTLYQWRNRAFEAIHERIRKADVNQSVFLTMLGRGSDVDGAGSKDQDRSAESPARQCRDADSSAPTNRPSPKQGVAMPEIRRFGDIVRWVIEEMGALCPSLERLKEYAKRPEAPEFSDILYHVEEAGCRHCRIELDLLR
jgi:DNA-directed RNA polymerase specialized sigma24 family protein